MTNYDQLLERVRQCGMDAKWSAMFIKKLKDDELAFPTTETSKHWALKRGFYPGRVELYGLTDENVSKYLPDFNYFMIHPINHHFRIWINDKLTLKYVLNSNNCKESMPEYYLYIENNGRYTYLMDAPESIMKDEVYIYNLLKEKGALALKPNSGTSGGRGFIKLDYRNGSVYENNNIVDIHEFERITSGLRNYIVTEYAYQHQDLARIWPSSECTLRITMIKLPNQNAYLPSIWQCVVSYARFGTSISGGASNLSSGGIGVGFDFDTGKLKEFGIRYKRFCPDGKWKCNRHPDTHISWESTVLPNWGYIKSMIERICQHVASLDYLGFDIIITPSGLKLCEINSHPAADYEQVMCDPILSTDSSRAFFENKGLNKVSSNTFHDIYLMSQDK